MGRRVGPTVQEQMRNLRASLTSNSGLPHDEVDALALRLSALFQTAMTTELEKLSLSAPLSGRVDVTTGNLNKQPESYRLVPTGANIVYATITSAAPATGTSGRKYGIAIARPDNETGADFIVFNPTGVLVEAFTRELHPVASEALTYRLSTIAEDQLLTLVGEAVAAGEAALRQMGYTL